MRKPASRLPVHGALHPHPQAPQLSSSFSVLNMFSLNWFFSSASSITFKVIFGALLCLFHFADWFPRLCWGWRYFPPQGLWLSRTCCSLPLPTHLLSSWGWQTGPQDPYSFPTSHSSQVPAPKMLLIPIMLYFHPLHSLLRLQSLLIMMTLGAHPSVIIQGCTSHWVVTTYASFWWHFFPLSPRFSLCRDVSIWGDSFSLMYEMGGLSARCLQVMTA